jgi:pimeloyl-ACP methyl ester carboxylesterase
MANTWIGKAFISIMAKADAEKDKLYISSSGKMKAVHEQVIAERMAPARAEASDIDYRFVYGRIEEVSVESLAKLYRVCPVGITWYTSDGEVFFGPQFVEQIAKDLEKAQVEIVNVPGATHADIYVRKDVWESMYAKMTQGRESEQS